jgi:hypothetical protein
MNEDRFTRVLTFLRQLEDAKLHFRLERYREDAISVQVDVPGERWEVDFLNDGSVDVERFKSDGEIYDESAFAELFTKFGETDALTAEAKK